MNQPQSAHYPCSAPPRQLCCSVSPAAFKPLRFLAAGAGRIKELASSLRAGQPLPAASSTQRPTFLGKSPTCSQQGALQGHHRLERPEEGGEEPGRAQGSPRASSVTRGARPAHAFRARPAPPRRCLAFPSAAKQRARIGQLRLFTTVPALSGFAFSRQAESQDPPAAALHDSLGAFRPAARR